MGLLNLQFPRNQPPSRFRSGKGVGVVGSAGAARGSGRESGTETPSSATSREKKSGAVQVRELHWGVSREISLRKTE